jgi:hypothetical protein
MLGKKENWCPLTRPLFFPRFMLMFSPWHHFSKNWPQDHPLPNHVGKSW